MIKTQTLFDLYNESNKRQIDSKIRFVEEQQERIKNYLPKVEEVKHILSLYVKYTDVLNGKISTLPKEVLDREDTKDRYAQLVLKTYYELYQPMSITSKEIKELQKETLQYPVFRHILKTFNEKVSQYIIDTGKAFEDPIFGAIKVKYKENVAGMVDWGQSNRNKKTLIEKGLRPYSKEEDLKAQEEGVPYDGIKWLAPGYVDGMLVVKWSLSSVIKEYLGDDMRFVKYYPARGKYGIVNLLSSYYTKGEAVDFTKYEPVNYTKTT